MSKRSRRESPLDELLEQFAIVDAIREQGVDPQPYIDGAALSGKKLKLPKYLQQDVINRTVIEATQAWNPPAVSEAEAFAIGNRAIHRRVVTSGIGVFGASGSGKTTLLHQIIDFCYGKRIRTRTWDIKGEARQYHQFWPAAMVFTPMNAPWQWLSPPVNCDPLTYFIGLMSEMKTELDLRPETVPLAWSIYERILRGLGPDDPYPSWSDFRRVLQSEAAEQKRENLWTLARAFLSVETILGPNARVRRVPDTAGRYLIEAYDLVGHDPAVFRLFLGFLLNRLLVQAHAEEHTEGLRRLEIIDEAAPVCSVERLSRISGNLSSVKRFASQCRFMGTGLVIGAQNISQIDPFMKNLGTVVVLRQPSVDDAEDAASMLGLPSDDAESLLRLDIGEGWLRSVGWPRPVKIQVTPLER